MVVVSRDRSSQHDICADRPADLGSSCCTLFCAQLAAKVLAAASESKQTEALLMDNVQALLWMCVKEWDRMRKDGADPRESLEGVCAREGLETKILADDVACGKEMLEQILASAGKSAPPGQSAGTGAARSQFGAMITGIPTGGDTQSQLGDTFLLLGLPARVVVVDSHRHMGQKAAGTLIAEGKTVQEVVAWIFQVLLKELACSVEYVSVTAFTLKKAALNADMTLADFVRQSGNTRTTQQRAAKSSSVPSRAAGEQGSQSSTARSSDAAPPSATSGAARSQAQQQATKSSSVSNQAAGEQGSQASRARSSDAASSSAAGGAVRSQAQQQAAKPSPVPNGKEGPQRPKVRSSDAAPLGRKPCGTAPASAASSAARSQGVGGPVRCDVLNLEAMHTCTKFSARCAQCKWQRQGPAWQNLDTVSFVDAAGQKVTPIVEKPKHLGGAWGIGCALCASARSTVQKHKFQAWAKFEVTDAKSVRKQNIVRHCKSEHHKAAVRMAQQPPPVASERPAGFSTTSGSQPEPGLDAVPRVERFVWAIQNVARGGSFRDFQKWCETNDLTSQLTSEGVCRDSSRQCAAKLTFCVAAVKVEERQSLLRRALRLSFAVDDRDQVFVMRARASFVRPRVGSEDFFVGLVRDYGYETADSAEAIWQCLRSLCTVRRGRREISGSKNSGSQPEIPDSERAPCGVSGPGDYVDEELLRQLVAITVAGASDGCKVALNSIQEVQKRHLKNIRYQFRDRPHTTRTCQKGVLKYMNEGRELMSALISGKRSFAKRAKHSRRFQQIWLRKQMEALAAARRRGGGSQPDLFVALQNLSHAEHRFDSRSEPMSIMCSRFGVIVEVLLEIADDAAPSHRDDRAWALGVLNLISGAEGFKKLLIFGVDCDFAVATQILVRVQDGISPDVALSAGQVRETAEVVEALFREGQVFLPEAEGMYTSQLLRGLRRIPRASRERMKWPEVGSQPGRGSSQAVEADFDLSGPRAYCQTLYKMVKEFFRLNFPDYDWRRKFGVFNCGPGCFPLELRLQYVGELAKKERVNPDAARSQFLMALPHMKRLYKETGDNRDAWCAYAELLRSRKGRHGVAADGPEHGKNGKPRQTLKESAGALLAIVLTYICLLDCTSDVERMFAQLAMQEEHRRERRLCPALLSAVLTVAVEVPSNIDSLVIRATEVGSSLASCRPRPFLLKAMRKYAEFYGSRAFASRSTVVQPAHIRAAQIQRCRVGTPRPAKHVTKQDMKRRWCAAAKTMVQALRQKRRQPAALRQTKIDKKKLFDKKKLSKTSRKLHKAVMSAQERTQGIEKRKFVQMEAKSGLVPPVAPLQGMPRKPRGVASPLPKARPKTIAIGGVAKGAKGSAVMGAAVASPLAKARPKTIAAQGAAVAPVAAPPPGGSAAVGVAKKKPSATVAPGQPGKKIAALSQAVSPKWQQKLRRAAETVAAAKTVAPCSPSPCAGVSLFRLARGPVAVI